MLGKLRVPHVGSGDSVEAFELFDHVQIFPDDKKKHCERLHDSSGIPYEEMLFFDDKAKNRDVEDLGVVIWRVEHGVTLEEVDQGVKSWRRRNDRM